MSEKATKRKDGLIAPKLVLGVATLALLSPFNNKCLSTEKPFCCSAEPCDAGFNCVTFSPDNKTIPHPEGVGVCLRNACCDGSAIRKIKKKKPDYRVFDKPSYLDHNKIY